MIANMDNLQELQARVNLELGTHISTEYNFGGVRLYSYKDSAQDATAYLTGTIPIGEALKFLEGCLYTHYLD